MEKSFLIYGGDLVNKGAQAMTYITVFELRKRYPNCRITLLSTKDAKRSDIERKKYKFDIKPLTLQTMLYYMGGLYCVIANLIGVVKKKKPDTELKDLFKKSSLMVNISGYALSSQWGIVGSLSYLFSIAMMKHNGIKVALFPQSFGPFNFKDIQKWIFNVYAKKILTYPDVIYAREKEGYEILKNSFHLNNIKLSTDLVLQNSEMDYSVVLRDNDENFIPAIEEGAVAIIPNIRTFKNVGNVSVYDIYKASISFLENKGYKVYILAHSEEDTEICENLKSMFSDNERIVYIKQELSSTEYSSIVSKFKYVIAARFHSIVHAYKEGVPCIALGWAVKYQELMKLFEQDKYAVDIRTIQSEDEFIRIMELMDSNYENNAIKIQKELVRIQKDNCFCVIDSIME